jgi:hypothetical protein
MKIARKHIENFQKGKVVGEEYYPLGSTNFGSLINKIKLPSRTASSPPWWAAPTWPSTSSSRPPASRVTSSCC